ncbi:hypothetical protein PS2_033679 [Malus domestica]
MRWSLISVTFCRYESKIIEDIVRYIFTKVNQTISSIHTDLIGMDSRVKEVLSFLDTGLNNVSVLGIWGMGGMGKTTIAEVVFDKIRSQFEAYSFLANVREVTEKQGLVHLQKQLLSDILFESHVDINNIHMGMRKMRQRLRTRMVLIILDDVDQLEQLEALCGHSWFGSGSRIIITSRDEHLLRTYGVDKMYKVKPLTDDEALQLFGRKAFKKDLVGEDFLELSNNVVEYANGLPLAIEVLGSFLFGRSIEVWSSALDRLKENPDRRITDVLKVSFDALHDIEKTVFLDIACFFKGEDKDHVIRILESNCGYRPDIDIAVLMEKSLLTLFGRKLWMHDLIQELGWEIVRRECSEEPGKRSRLWLPKDIIHVLVNDEGTIAVEGIFLNFPKEEEVFWNVDPFPKMPKLRLLRISNVTFSGCVKYLSNELQLLEWHECPLSSFPSNFQSNNLVELIMHSSFIKELWRGNQSWRMLQFIDLSGSKYLIKTPNFSEAPNIETLVLQDCTRLVEVHPSIGVLKKLILLNMRNCKRVESLPPSISLESLEIFILSACSRLKKFPEIGGYMGNLLELHLDGTAIQELPTSIECLPGLTLLNLQDCKNLLHLPSTIQYLTSLKSLNLSGCSELDEMPANLSSVECLERLDISGTAIRESSFILDMKNLQFLSLQGCKDLPPKSWHSLFNCWWWGKKVQGPLSLLLPTSFSGLTSLTKLNLSDCNLTEGEVPNDLGGLFSLEILNLSGNNFVSLPEGISQLCNLKSLNVSHCSKLQLLPKKLPLSVRQVNADDCIALIDFKSQFKIWTSNDTGITTISHLIPSQNQQLFPSSRNIKDLTSWTSTTIGGMKTTTVSCLKSSVEHPEWKAVDEFSVPAQVLQKDLEGLDFTASPYQSVSTRTEIPEWYTDTATRESIAIPLSPDLDEDKKWIGVALCAVFSVKGDPAVSHIGSSSETSNYFYRCKFGTSEFIVEPLGFDTENSRNLVKSSSNVCAVFYVPCLGFRKMLNKSGAMWAAFETDNPSMKVQKCGIRLVYKQDVAGFIHKTMQDDHEGFRHQTPSQDNCNPIEVNKAIELEYGWFNLVDNILEWENFTAAEKGSTILLRRNIESLLPRYLEGLHHMGQFYQFGLSGSPAWFNPRVGSSVSTQLPKTLYKNKKWMGVALCVSISVLDWHKVKGGYKVSCQVNSGNFHIELSLCSTNFICDKSQLWIIYIPKAELPEWFTRSSSSSTLFRIDNSAVEVQVCGYRVFYRQDLKGFVQTIIQCILRSSDTTLFEKYNKKMVEDWLTLVRWQGLKIDRELSRQFSSSQHERELFQLILSHYRNQDWSVAECTCRFPGIEIPKWFAHLNKGGSAQIQLPPNLFDDANWMGIAACSYASIHEHPTVILDTPDSEFSRALYCYLDTNLPNVRLHGLEHTNKALWLHACNFTWFTYAPRAKFSGSLNQCNLVRATFGSNSPGLGLHQCGLRLVFKEDVEDLVQTLTLCRLSAKCYHSEQARHGN